MSADLSCLVLVQNKAGPFGIVTPITSLSFAPIQLSSFFPFRLTMKKLYTKCNHRCVYLLKDTTVMHLAWLKQHFCLVGVNSINEKEKPVSTLHYTECWLHQKQKGRFSHPASGTSHSAPAWCKETSSTEQTLCQNPRIVV